MDSHAASLEALKSDKTFARLNQIDTARSLGIGDYISLPQVVVCGEQSAGKSSVLEGMTGIPFPRQDGLCTRFATEIILRHSAHETSIKASILPASSRSIDDRGRLEAFKAELRGFEELPDLIARAGTLMGLRGFSAAKDAPTFCADTLRLEYTGKTGLHLTVVDLPGLISVSENELDVQVVSDLVDKYLKCSRTVILAVVEATSDIETQIIMKKVQTFDKSGERTVGVITKPDLINKGTEERVATLFHNKEKLKLKLGFFLLKNPSPQELQENITMSRRVAAEMAFFTSGAWQQQCLDMERVGIEKLRIFMQELLDRHVESEMPAVRSELKAFHDKTKSEFQSLGAERASVNKKKIFLSRIAQTFYNVTRASLQGTYDGEHLEFFRTTEHRLRAQVHLENTYFAAVMRDYSKKRRVVRSSNDLFMKAFPSETQLEITAAEMKSWVRQVYRDTHGLELPGDYNYSLLSDLFHQQSSLWPQLGTKHIDSVHKMVVKFADDALEHFITDVSVRTRVSEYVHNGLAKRHLAAQRELDQLLEDEKLQPITYNHYFTDNIQKAREDRVSKQISDIIDRVSINTRESANTIRESMKAYKSHITVDMEDQACEDALTELDAYYKVAQKTFVDNVCRQAIERRMLRGLADVFSPDCIIEMADEEIEYMAFESQKVIARRKELETLLSMIEASRRELAK